jgi:hypothetical protein
MELSLAGLLGAMIGTAIGVVNYAVVVGFVEGRLRALDKSQTAEEREEFERKISAMRKIVLAIDIFAFGGIGYWFGKTIAG